MTDQDKKRSTERRGDIAPSDDSQGERTRRASFDPRSGEVHGSGSGAGGGGNPNEDYDSDPAAGGGAKPEGGPRPIDEAACKPEDKHRGGVS